MLESRTVEMLDMFQPQHTMALNDHQRYSSSSAGHEIL
jgi:hypothetical protein